MEVASEFVCRTVLDFTSEEGSFLRGEGGIFKVSCLKAFSTYKMDISSHLR